MIKNDKALAAWLRKAAEDDTLLYMAHKKIEDIAIMMRDSRISVIGAANGIVVREYDASPSDIIRIGTRDAVAVALKAIAEYLDG